MSSTQVTSHQSEVVGHQTVTRVAARPRLLRIVLIANACISILSGVVFLFRAKEIATLAGITSGDMRIIGGSTLLFAGVVIRAAAREVIRPREVWPFVAIDAAWIAGTAIVMASGVLSPAGNWLFGCVACVVLFLALGELLGLRQLGMRES